MLWSALLVVEMLTNAVNVGGSFGTLNLLIPDLSDVAYDSKIMGKVVSLNL